MIFSVRRPQHFISHSKSQRSLVTRQRELGAPVVGTTKRWQRSLDRGACMGAQWRFKVPFFTTVISEH